ncbi:hypothetical protein J7T55_004610 [Diaporthe amygdali]|uniref:uncharacterized protein n=1 Tax=Phomopsis amygdali TaxID=1214568 RepID=UPI0022FDEFB2|nr:uncharacterized protein J7T55_004610 [Diaporthe amygdali]KAJ0114868.1 hypothetical protein J7T55_004610 [Diaporthe amygdali]
MAASSATLPLPLPRIGGPKLNPFRGTATAEIKFIRYVGSEDDLDSKVWKVSIDGKFYALKIFHFHYWKGLMKISGKWIISREDDPEGDRPLTPQEYLNYLDPFNNECRVYGRLKQEKREDIAVRAHGYILLTPEQEQRVTEGHGREYVDPETLTSLGNYELDEESMWYRRGCNRHERVRAIIKDFVDESTPDFEKSQIRQMYDDIETLHSLSILIRDMHPGNYLGGKLIDFSRSWTMYHPGLDRISWHDICQLRREEPRDFEKMIVAWAYVHDTRIPIPKAIKEWQGGLEGCGINPCDYDWRKWENFDEVDAPELDNA